MPHKFLLVLAIALGIHASAHGQSLGDIARANREKQGSANPAATQPAVITSDDLEPGAPIGSAGKDAQHSAGKKAVHEPAQPDGIDPRAAAQELSSALAAAS